MASSSIETAAQWLGKLVVEEVEFLGEVSEKVEELQSELEWMQCFLRDADEKQSKNTLISKWVFHVRDLALEAEDLIETYVLKVSRKRQHGFRNYLRWLCCFLRDAKTLHNIGSGIDSLTAKISKMTSRIQSYGVKSSYDMHASHDMFKRLVSEERRTYCHVDDEAVVGVEDSVNDLVDKLKNDVQNIVVVHGMGGIGKSILARELFRHTSLKGHFSGFAWAYISQQLQLGPVCREILLQIIPENDQQRRTKIQGLPESQLPGELYEMLKQNKYLIVLDDVWFVRDWLCLEPAFPVNDISHGSKLIITTRNPQILSDLAHNIVSYYEVKLLDRLKSWELLQIKGNFSKDNADPGMVEIGEKMLDHCNGHPLAIAVLGGVLATKKTEQEWRSVLEDLPSHLQRDESYTGVYEVLGMSYYELPYNVKPCFLHFVNFPEDFEIPIERIYNLWIAEGILSSAHDQSTQKRSSMEEIAEVYLQELVQRGMIKLGKKDYQGEFSTCHLHDLMRDKGLEIVEKEGFLKIVDHRLGVANNSTRRVTVYVGDEEISNSLEKALSGKRPPLRSIMLFQGKDGREESSEWIKSVCQDFELLRVLDLEGARLQGSLPCKVENLLFLRHLSLKDTGISELPSSISTLKSLLILDLQVSGVITLPNILWKLSSLIHLYLPSRNVSRKVEREGPYRITDGTPLILDNLKCLEKLVGVNLDKLDQKGLEQLTSLRKFTATCIYNKSILQTMLRSPSIKCMRLKLDAGLLCVDPMLLSACTCLKVLSLDANTNLIPYLPLRPKMFPQCLVNLDISFCKFKTDPMPILETLPNLHGLGLHVCYDGLKLSCSAQGFPRLTYLAFDGLCCVQEWDVQQGGLSKLQNLNLYNFFIPMLPLALPPLLTISCFPCVPGVDRFGPCPHA